MSSLEFTSVTVRYGKREVVRSFSASVTSGGWLGLIGPNGAGKSSLLRAAVGLVDHAGDVLVDGVSLSLRSRSRRAALLAYVPQNPLLPYDMTALEYVLLGRAPYVGYFATESRHDRALARDVLGRLDVSEFADRRLGQLSGGEQQRLVIAPRSPPRRRYCCSTSRRARSTSGTSSRRSNSSPDCAETTA